MKPIPDGVTNPPSDDIYLLVVYFNELRSMTGDYEKPITMDLIEGWQRHKYIKLEKWERESVFAMDRAFRRSVSEVLEFHSKRKQTKLGADKDYRRANG